MPVLLSTVRGRATIDRLTLMAAIRIWTGAEGGAGAGIGVEVGWGWAERLRWASAWGSG